MRAQCVNEEKKIGEKSILFNHLLFQELPALRPERKAAMNSRTKGCVAGGVRRLNLLPRPRTLMDSTKPQAADFQDRFPLLRILDPVSFLREIGDSL
jgi:hypothetical protein